MISGLPPYNFITPVTSTPLPEREDVSGNLAASEGKITADGVEFTVVTDQFKAIHKGTIAGNDMKLSVDLGDRTIELTAKRSTT